MEEHRLCLYALDTTRKERKLTNLFLACLVLKGKKGIIGSFLSIRLRSIIEFMLLNQLNQLNNLSERIN